jgi:type IV secretion system protein VirD4
MGWLQNTLRDYAGDIIGGHVAPNGQQQRQQQPRKGARGPARDYLTEIGERGWQPIMTPSGLLRLDATIPDDYLIASRNNPDHALRVLRTQIMRDRLAPWTIPLGMCGGTWFSSDPQRHVLAIAPPRAEAGKTASLIIPATLSHPNPVVTASTKADVLTATAMARAQYGKLWCYAPSGSDDVPAGVNDLRWSPLSGADEWDVAVATATAMAGTLDSRSMSSGDHWKDRAADLLAAVFHWAALTGATMREARNVVYEHTNQLARISEELAAAGAEDAARALMSVRDAHREEAKAIASTAARALKGYRTDAALKSTENARFDIDDFVNGGPYGVRADTIYITARSDEQRLVAPLVVGFLDQIQRAIYKRHRRLEAAGLIEQPGAAPILFALDELYGLAPLPDLPHILSEGGSQGLLIAAAIQDLSLIESRWKDEAGAFMTMFGHVLVYPGIRDVKTLEAVSKLAGSYDHETRSPTVKKDIPPGQQIPFFSPWHGPTIDKEESATVRRERRPLRDPHQVMLGVDPRDHDKLIHFGPRGVGTVKATPYFREAPWPMLLTRYLEHAISGCVPEWRYWESQRSGEPLDAGEDTLAQLPVPRLRDWYDDTLAGRRPHPCDRAWASRYEAARQHRERIVHGAPRQAQPEPSTTITRHGPWVVTAPAGQIPPSRPAPPPPPAPHVPSTEHDNPSPSPDPAIPESEARPPAPPPPPPDDDDEPTDGEDGGSTPDPPPLPSPSPAAPDAPGGDDPPETRSDMAGPHPEQPDRQRDGNDDDVPGPPPIYTDDAPDPSPEPHGDDAPRSDTGTAEGEDPAPEPAAATPAPDGTRLYFTSRREAVDVTDEDIRLLASGAYTPTAEQLADVWGSYRVDVGDGSCLMSDFEARSWRTAQAAAAKPEEARSADDNGNIAWAVQRYPSFEPGTPLWVRNLATTENIRRHAGGDSASVSQYEEAVRHALDATYVEGSPAWRDQQMRSAVLQRRAHSHASNWASVTPRLRYLMLAFILRRDLEAHGQPQRDDDGRLARIAPALEALEAEAVRLSVPVPVARFDFDAWGPEDDEAMRARAEGNPYPERWYEILDAFDDAISQEKNRRRGCGDTASVERYERARSTLGADIHTKPWVAERGGWELAAALAAGQDWGCWKYLAPDPTRLDQAFLLGEDCGPGDDEAPPPTELAQEDPAPTAALTEPLAEPFPFEADWTSAADEAMWAHTRPPARYSGRAPEGFHAVRDAIRSAIAAEKQRRLSLGDSASVEAFTAAWQTILAPWKHDPDYLTRARDEIAEALERGEDLGLWKWFPPEYPRTLRSFLRGEGTAPSQGGTAAPPTDASDPIPDVTDAAEEVAPEPERWEPQWGPADDETMREWPASGEEPECFRRTHDEMQAAIEREKDRRHVIGDARSIWLFEDKRAQLLDRTKNPRPNIAEVLQRDVIGFWALLPPGLEELTMAFLHGEDLKLAYGEGPTPPPAEAADDDTADD